MSKDSSLLIVQVFCPVCDREYLGRTREVAYASLEQHIKGAHPDYYEGVYDIDD